MRKNRLCVCVCSSFFIAIAAALAQCVWIESSERTRVRNTVSISILCIYTLDEVYVPPSELNTQPWLWHNEQTDGRRKKRNTQRRLTHKFSVECVIYLVFFFSLERIHSATNWIEWFFFASMNYCY